MRRDRLTFAMIIGMPIVQLVLFGYAINTDPKHLPTAVVVADNGPVGRSIVTGNADVELFRHRRRRRRPRPRRAACWRAATFPSSSPSRSASSGSWSAGERPQILVEADATDPAATGDGSARSPRSCGRRSPTRRSGAARQRWQPGGLPVDVVIHRLYNPEGITAYNIVPGLLGTILTMTTILMTALALTREVERGTMENLMAMPARPLRDHDRQDRALYRLRLPAGGGDPHRGVAALPGADAGADGRAPVAHAPLHRRQCDARLHLLDRRAEPDAGDADDLLLLSAVDPAVRLHVPVSRHARLGAGDRRGDPAHPLSSASCAASC